MKTKAQHTPGPWHLEKRAIVPVIILDSEGEHVGSVSRRGEETPHNARLIAAAPRLSKALEGLLTSGALYDDGTNPKVTAAIREAMLAAQEARGESGGA